LITLNVTHEEKTRSFDFAEEIIFGRNQFNRFSQTVEIQVIRTYVGKLAEYLFLHFLQSRKIEVKEGDMFQIFEGSENSDTFDFLLPNGHSIDIKTASLPFHQRIMVPITQFHLIKDYYVGIKLNFLNTSPIIQPFSINTAIIYGYINRAGLETAPTYNFGEGDCKAYFLKDLIDIEHLILMYNDTGRL